MEDNGPSEAMAQFRSGVVLKVPVDRVRIVLTVVAAMTTCIVVVLVVAQAVLYVRDMEESERLASAALARAEAISEARRIASSQAARLEQPTCSADDIDALKEIAFSSSYIRDIGRIRGGRVICSALWGWSRPFSLPPPRFASGSIRLWYSSDIAGSPYRGTNLIAQGDTFTVSSPAAFESVDPARTSSISVEKKDRSFAFRTLPALRDEEGPTAVHTQQCSRVTDICAFVTSPRSAVWELPLVLLAAILAVGACIGLLLALLLIRHHVTARQTIEQRLLLALKHGEIKLAYQPLRRITTRELVGFEALSRWRPPGEDEIPPSFFVPIAHRFGLTSDLFRHVLSTAMDELSPALRQHDNLYVSVNAEPGDMAQDWIVRYITSITGESGVRPHQLRIEITEREELVSETAKDNMCALSRLGYQFLIDDFGTGAANFSQLAQSPIGGVKLDRMFVAAITEDSPLRPVLPGMCRIALELGLDVIVEGVETEEQARMLSQIAPDAVGQGWYFGRPVPAADAIATIDEAWR